MMSTTPRRTKADLMQHRWVLLTRFAEAVPGFTIRTLQYWAKTGKIPASRRFGTRWWVDMKAFAAMRKNQSDDLLADFGDFGEECDLPEVA